MDDRETMTNNCKIANLPGQQNLMKAILLLEVSNGWRLQNSQAADVSQFVESTSPIEIANATIDFSKKHRLDRRKVVIAVASTTTLFTTIQPGDAVNITNHQSLRFALEALLPVNAESIVADSIHISNNPSIGLSAAAMESDHLQALIDQLESCECRVQFVVSASMMVFEQAMAERVLKPNSSVIYLENSCDDRSGHAEIASFDGQGKLTAWQVSDARPISVSRLLELINPEELPVVLLANRSAMQRHEMLQELANQSVVIDPLVMQCKATRHILSNRREPTFDFRRDQLAASDPLRRYRIAISSFVISGCIALLLVCGTLLWRSFQYQAMARQATAEQATLFKKAFPEQRVPAAILSRLKSEHAKAIGIRKVDNKTKVPASALQVLRRILESLNDELPFEIDQIRIENGSIVMEVKFMSQQDAGKLAAALADQGLEVEPPSTSLTDDDRISATILASYRQADFEKPISMRVRQ